MIEADFWRFCATISATMIGLVFVGTFYYLESGWESFRFVQGELEELSVDFAKLIIAYFSTTLLLSIAQEPFLPTYVQLISFVALAIATGVATMSLSNDLEYFHSLSYETSIRWGKIGNWLYFAVVFVIPFSIHLWGHRSTFTSSLIRYPRGEAAAWVVLLALVLGYWYLIQFLLLPYQSHKRERDIAERMNKKDVRSGETPSNETWDDDQMQFAKDRITSGLNDEGLVYQPGDYLSGELDEPILHFAPQVSDLGEAMIHVQITDDWTDDKQLLDYSCLFAQNVGSVALDSHRDLTGVEVRIWRRQLLPEKEHPDDFLVLKLRWEHHDLNALETFESDATKIRKSVSDILFNTNLFPRGLIDNESS